MDVFYVDKNASLYIIDSIDFLLGCIMEFRDLKPGTRLKLEILGNNGGRLGNAYISQVLEPSEDRNLIISTPIYESRLIYVPLNGKVRITFIHSKYGLQGFTAIVTSREQMGNLSILFIQAETTPEKIQRRTHYRLECIRDVEYKICTNITLQGADSSTYNKALTKNISGSGACIAVDEEIKKDTFLDIRINLGEGIIVKAKCLVLRSMPLGISNAPKYELGLHFIEITPQNQDYIIKFIFEQQRRLLKKECL